MKLITDNGPGNVHESAGYCNQFGLAPFVIGIHFSGGYHSTILMKVEKYVDYLKVCKVLRRKPMTEEEFLK